FSAARSLIRSLLTHCPIHRLFPLWPFLIALSFALRLYHLDAQPIWWDEAISIRLATSSLPDLLTDRAAHVHPPLYFLLLKAWVTLAGSTAFSARFLSAWFNTLLVPAVYAFGHRWLGRRAGAWAALLVAISPLYVVYAQEARAYALLPLVYLALLDRVERVRARACSPTRRDWLLLGLAEAIGLYLHYVFLLAVVYTNLLLLPALARRRRWGGWLGSVALVGLLLLPWAVAVALHWPAVLADAGVDAPFVEPVPLEYFVRLLWTFQWSGLTGAPGHPPIRWTATALAASLLAGIVALAGRKETRGEALRLLGHWLGPLTGALLLWQLKPLSHPRYVALFAVALFILVAYLLNHLGRRRATAPLAALLGLAVLAVTLTSLHAYFANPRFAKDDTQGVAAALSAHAASGDLILVPPEDWSVPYYYNGPAQVAMVWPDEAWDRLGGLTHAGQTAYQVDYYRATRDPGGLLSFGLEAAGSLVDRWGFKGLFVRVYRLERPVGPPAPGPVAARFGPLELSGVWAEQGAPADTALSLALRWRLAEPTDGRLRVGLRLRDDEGWAWTATDDWLLDPRGNPTDRWDVGQEVTTYHLLPLPPGTPPLTYTLTVGVYWVEGEEAHPLDLLDEAGNPQGQSLELRTVSLGQPLGLEADPYGLADRVPLWEAPVEMGDGLILTGASLDRATVAPGQPLFVTLRWRGQDGSRPYVAALSLVQRDMPLVVVPGPIGGRYPIDRWSAGQTVVEHRRLVVPPAATDGPAAVVLQVGDRRVELGTVAISAAEHRFEPPPMGHAFRFRFGDVAELLGYDLTSTEVTASEPVTITLYWRALEGAARADYTVFTHILAEDGRLVGQHDGPPAGGARPTPGWVPGEVIVDRHVMTFREPYAGIARIEIGLYDLVTMERVPAETGATFILLPTALTVEQP
ncbi:MAG TPA: hypothetical protein EYH30_07885, partial [Anaerolineales bacterium]|nr:hypothetical protein [Anaerolineales bacterium]